MSHGGATPLSEQADFILQNEPPRTIQLQKKGGTEYNHGKHNEKIFDRYLAAVVHVSR